MIKTNCFYASLNIPFFIDIQRDLQHNGAYRLNVVVNNNLNVYLNASSRNSSQNSEYESCDESDTCSTLTSDTETISQECIEKNNDNKSVNEESSDEEEDDCECVEEDQNPPGQILPSTTDVPENK